MTTFTIDDLRTMLQTTAGESLEADWSDPTIADSPFGDIGYDSLAVLELGAVVARHYAIEITDEAFADLHTPHAVISYVNDRLVGAERTGQR